MNPFTEPNTGANVATNCRVINCRHPRAHTLLTSLPLQLSGHRTSHFKFLVLWISWTCCFNLTTNHGEWLSRCLVSWICLQRVNSFIINLLIIISASPDYLSSSPLRNLWLAATERNSRLPLHCCCNHLSAAKFIIYCLFLAPRSSAPVFCDGDQEININWEVLWRCNAPIKCNMYGGADSYWKDFQQIN